MGRCYCRRRRVVIFVCTPCISLALLFIYVSVMLCRSINHTANQGVLQPYSINLDYFKASGTFTNKSFAPLPKTFWNLHLNGNALWNQLQLTVERYLNPILGPNNITWEFDNSTFHESLLKQSFSTVIELKEQKEKFDQLPQHIQDFVTHMQKRDYPMLIQPDGMCGAGTKNETEPPLLLLAIKTTENSFKNRQTIRKTWGQVGWVARTQKSNNSGGQNLGGYVRRVFLLGKEDPDELGMDFSPVLHLENKNYGDILQWDFKDTFFNLTLKDVLFWSWFSRSCGRTHFVFKGDDDVFVNTPKMVTYLQEELQKPQAQNTIQNFMVGDVIAAAQPNRVNTSKYFIPHSLYKGLYPMYAGGGGVVYSGALTRRLNHISKMVHLFPVDDVYVGMCMFRLNLQPIHHPAFLTFDFPKNEREEPCSYHTILLVHKRSPTEVLRLWAELKKTQTQCLDVPLRDGVKKETKAALVDSLSSDL